MMNDKPISIEDALNFGESDRFYHVLDHIDDEAIAEKEDEDYE